MKRQKRCYPIVFTSLLLCFTLLLTATWTRAEKVSVDEMDLVSQNWLSRIVFEKNQWAAVTNPKIDKIDDIVANDTLLGRVYSIAPEGYIIVPVLKELPPIQIYSEEGFFNVDETEGFPALVKEVLQNRLRNFIHRYGILEYSTANEDRTNFTVERLRWSQLAVSQAEFNSSLNKSNLTTMATTTVGPLLTSRWHQDAPYNNYCPYGDGGRTLVGCVATAAAQILAYHQWPPEGTGQYSYYWPGDGSCEGSSSGTTLEADYTDSYDWANIPDYCGSSSPSAQKEAVAELNYEVGVAFNMDYGYCGSGAYTADAMYVFPTYFRYLNVIDKEDRNMHSATSWFYVLSSEIDAGRPMQYRISSHSIVCDGWQQVDDLNQIHLNYGWGGSYNAWFTIDNLHCDWDGCDPMVEYVMTNIIPDKGVNFTADTTVGWTPFEVQFNGESEHTVDTWTWDFGDGETANGQTISHFYQSAGIFDVELEITAEGDTYSYIKSNYIITLADSIKGTDVEGPIDSVLDIPVVVTNNIPLNRMQIPVEYDGPLDLKYTGYSIAGCRTENFEEISFINYDANNKRFTLDMAIGSATDMTPGTGPIIILKFKIQSVASGQDTTSLKFDGYKTYLPWFFSYLLDYQPILIPGVVTYTGCCLGTTGNVNCSESDVPDISDITRLIDFLYNSHTALCCPEEADSDASGGNPDIADITAIIDFLYLSHEALPACN